MNIFRKNVVSLRICYKLLYSKLIGASYQNIGLMMLMKYTIQLHTESGNFAQPLPQDVIHLSSLDEIKFELETFQKMVHRFDDSVCEASVYFGYHNDVTDMHPDKIAVFGKNRGIKIKNI